MEDCLETGVVDEELPPPGATTLEGVAPLDVCAVPGGNRDDTGTLAFSFIFARELLVGMGSRRRGAEVEGVVGRGGNILNRLFSLSDPTSPKSMVLRPGAREYT